MKFETAGIRSRRRLKKHVESHSDWELSQISFPSSRLVCGDMRTRPACLYSAASFLLFSSRLPLPAFSTCQRKAAGLIYGCLLG